MSLLSLLVATTLAGVHVSGSSTCPVPSAVEARIVERGPKGLADLHAELTPDADGLHILLRDPRGEIVGERLLSGTSSCDELTDAAAVLIVSWSRQLKGRVQPASAIAERPQLPAQDLPAPEASTEEPLPVRVESAFLLDVAAGLSASLGAGDVALGGEFLAAVTARRGRMGGTVKLAALGARSAGHGSTWERFALSAGPHHRIDFGAIRMDVHSEFVAALLSVVSENAAATRVAFDPGVSGGVRLLGPGGMWGGVRASGWLTPQQLSTGDALPRFEVLLTAGLAWSSR